MLQTTRRIELEKRIRVSCKCCDIFKEYESCSLIRYNSPPHIADGEKGTKSKTSLVCSYAVTFFRGFVVVVVVAVTLSLSSLLLSLLLSNGLF